MRYTYETCLRSLLPEFAEPNRDCGALYQSDGDMQLCAFESTVKQRVYSTLASFDHSLEDFHRDDALADP